MKLSETTTGYIRNDLEKIDGWLLKQAAFLSAILLDFQKNELGYTGDDQAMLEIGVFKGRYLALLEQCTRDTQDYLLGADLYALEDQDIGTVQSILKSEGHFPDRVELLETDSMKFETIQEKLSGKTVRYIHVDGSHKKDHVFVDLKNADSILDDRGVIIMDDFWNVRALGVLQAVFEYFSSAEIKTNLAPLAISGGKLFLVRKPHHKAYFDGILSYSRSNPDIYACSQLIERFEGPKRFLTVQDFFENETLIF